MPLPKEGRYPLYCPLSPRRTRTTTKRLLLLVLFVVLSYSIVVSSQWPSRREQVVKKKDPASKNTKQAVSEADQAVEASLSVGTRPAILPEPDQQNLEHIF